MTPFKYLSVDKLYFQKILNVMLKNLTFSILIFCASTPTYAELYADDRAREEILKHRTKIRELNAQIEEITTKYGSEIKNLNARLDSIESENKKLKAENEKIKSDLDDRRLTRENPGYQELRDEINAIYRLLLQVIPK